MVVERVDAPDDVLLPPWLWHTYRVWVLSSGQWRTCGDTLMALDLLAVSAAMELVEVPTDERLETVQRVQVIEAETKRLLDCRQQQR